VGNPSVGFWRSVTFDRDRLLSSLGHGVETPFEILGNSFEFSRWNLWFLADRIFKTEFSQNDIFPRRAQNSAPSGTTPRMFDSDLRPRARRTACRAHLPFFAVNFIEFFYDNYPSTKSFRIVSRIVWIPQHEYVIAARTNNTSPRRVSGDCTRTDFSPPAS